MPAYFQKQGRALLGNGYLIIPIKPGEKRPALSNWQTARLGASTLSSYPEHGVGVLCGQGAHPIAAIDIDTTNEALAHRFVRWCTDNLGATCERVGKAPKILLVYRAKEEGWGKATGAWFEDLCGEQHRLEVLGKGQQFVAHHIHPDTGQPYEWLDLVGGLEFTRADELPIITEEQVREALAVFERMAEEEGLTRRAAKGKALAAVPAAPSTRTPKEDDDFFGRVNEAAMGALGAWVPALFPSAREYVGGYRVSSVDLGRDLEEDLSLVPEGIVDFGVADMGDEREGKRSPIDTVLEWAPRVFDDPLDAPLSAFDAALWLCDCLGAAKEDLGFGLRKQREQAAKRAAKREHLGALAARVETCDDSIVLLGDVAKAAREVLADTPELRTEVGALLKARYRELTNLTLSAADITKALREPAAPTVKSRRPLTEFGNAERMLDKYGQGLMYVPEIGAWYCWTGIYWRRAPDVEIQHYAKETVKALVAEIADHPEPAEFFKFCAVSQQARMVANMVSLAQSDPRVMVPAAELDKHSNLMGAQNGVIDLTTGDLINPDPELRITKVVGCNYAPNARAPLFRQTVLEVFNNDKDMADFLQRLVGYAAMGNPTRDVLVIPHGNGSNGKSTVLGTVRAAFGDYARSAEANSFVSDAKGGGNQGGAREDLVRLKGARFVYVNEPDEGGELREGSVKSMTGGDVITARGLYSKVTMDIVPSWVVFMPTNHKPIVKGSDNGIWRRLMLVPFTRNFDDDPAITKDPEREGKLLMELEGVLTWVVEGALAYQKQGIDPTETVKKAREDYRSQMDLLAEWLEECCEQSAEYCAPSASLWGSWEQFAKSRGLLQYVKNSVTLGRRLDARFPADKGAKGVRIRRGLRIREDFEALN